MDWTFEIWHGDTFICSEGGFTSEFSAKVEARDLVDAMACDLDIDPKGFRVRVYG